MGLLDAVLARLGYVPLHEVSALRADYEASVAKLTSDVGGLTHELEILRDRNQGLEEQIGHYAHANTQLMRWEQNLGTVLARRGIDLQALLEWEVTTYSAKDLDTQDKLYAVLRKMPDIQVVQLGEQGRGKLIAFNLVTHAKVDLPVGKTNYTFERAIRIFDDLGISNRIA